TFVGLSSGAWTWNMPFGSMTSPRNYQITARAVDQVGNLQPAASTTTVTFTYDTTPPISVATSPVGTQNNASAIYGTAYDPQPRQLKVVKVAIFESQGPNANNYWT